MSTFTSQRDRDAWNTIRGYVYQVDLTIERWLNLQPGQTLELECGEDIDIVSRSLTATPEERQRLLEQVKHRVSSITLKTSEAVTAIACFIEHRQTNPSANLLFRFTTNTQVGKEKLSPMPNKGSAIVAWEEIRQGNLQGTAQNAALQGIRTILKNVKQPDKLHDDTWQIFCNFITNASNDRLLDLICSFEWSTKAPDAQSLSPSLQKLLVDRKHARDNIEAQEQYRRLFLYVFKLLCEPGIKQLTVEERSHQLSLPTLSETDHQLLNNVVVWVQALEVRVQEHEERLGVLEQYLDRERTETYIGQEVADCVDNLLRDYTKLFVGRETTLKQLNEFLTQTRTNVLKLIAPAGFGKTALLANWVASRQDDGCFILYHFFSQRYDVTRSFSAAYRNLLRQLDDYYEPSDRQIPNNEDGLRDKLYRLIKEYSERDGRPLVIVLDALDEAEPPFRQFLPLVPENVFLIASARAEEGQETEYLRGWTDNALPIRLNRLCRGAIAHWIRQAGEGELAAFAEDTHFVAQLDEITQGFPLYLRYLTEELIQAQQKGEDVQVVLTRSPKGFAAYVQEQFKRLAQVEEIRRHREVQELFALLSVALGVLSEDDIQELTDLNEWDLAALPWQVTRWFSIQTGFYSFAHPLLAKEFQGVLKRQASSAKDKLIKYCSCWQEHQSRYALRHYAEHLREEKRWDELYAIARNEDFAATQREHLPDEPDLPLKTVQIALQGTAETDDPGGMAEFLLVHAWRLARIATQESPLDALRADALKQAWELADLDIEHCVFWYLLLVWELKDEDKLEEARATLERLQHKKLPRFSINSAKDWQGEYAAYFLAHVFDVSEDTCTALEQMLLDNYYRRHLCNILRDRDNFAAALKTVQGIGTDLEQVLELANIAKAQAKKRQPKAAQDTLTKALEITRKPAPNQFCVYCMGSIAQIQIEELEDTDAARVTFAEAIEIATKIPYQHSQVMAFVGVADMQAEVGMFAEALDTLQKFDGQPGLEDFLKDIAKVQAKVGEREKSRVTFTSAKQMALAIEDKNRRAEALLEIAWAETNVRDFTAALETAEEIDSQWHQAQALLTIVRTQILVEDLPAALATICKIKEPKSKSEALSSLAKAQAELEDFTTALETVKAIDSPVWRKDALVAIAKAQTEKDELTAALKTAEQIESESGKPEALVAIVKAQAELGNFPTALTTQSRIKDENRQQQALSAIAKAYAKAENFTEALQMAKGIYIPPMRVDTLGSIAEAQVAVGKTEAARATFAAVLKAEQEPEISISFLQAFALAEVAAVEVRNDRKEEGATTAGIVYKIAQSIDNPAEQANVLAGIAKILVQAGKIEEAKSICNSALEVAQNISERREDQRSKSLKLVAQAQASAGEFDAALETALMVKIESLFAQALKIIAQLQTEADTQQKERWKRILTNAHKFYENKPFVLWNPVDVLSTIAVARVAIGDKEVALATFADLLETAQAQKSRERDQNLSTIAAAWAKVGEIPTAIKITNEIEDGWEQVRAFSAIAWEQLDKKDKEALKKTLPAVFKARDKIEDEYKLMKALRIITQIQAMAGEGKQAVYTAERTLFNRNNLLCSIATILAEVNDKENFKKLLIPCAYYLDTAYEMCGYLARLYPEKAEEIAKVVSELN